MSEKDREVTHTVQELTNMIREAEQAAEERGRRRGVEERDELREALKALVDRLDFVHDDPRYISVWSLSQNHVGPYRGPTYVEELSRARVALAPRDAAPVCDCEATLWQGGHSPHCATMQPRDSGKDRP